MKNLYRLLYHLTFDRCKSFYCRYKYANISSTNKLILIDKYGNKQNIKFTKYISGIRFKIIGEYNTIILYEISQYNGVSILINGNNNIIEFGEKIHLNNCDIRIG